MISTTVGASPADITPFTIAVSEEQLQDLDRRLDATRWPSEIEGANWDYGTSLPYLRDLASYWRHEYDWRVHEGSINQWPQFVTEIDGTRVHFLHVRSPEPDATPLILTHGWPGSVVEFLDVIGPLSDPRAHGGDPSHAFHVVIPSVPGFGFSGPTNERGWSIARIARAWATLMQRLGYERYAIQGGDMGALISPFLGRVAGDAAIGVHVNAATVGFQPLGPVSDDLVAALDDADKAKLAEIEEFARSGSGYQAIQGTKPQTLAYGLADSPVGQLSWIVEKFKEWTNPSAELPEDAIARDKILTNVMLYWLTATGGSAARVYYESGRDLSWFLAPGADTSAAAPMAVANFAGDMAIRHFGEQSFNIVRWTEFDRGGHFAALEAPDLLLQDVREFFASLQAGTEQ